MTFHNQKNQGKDESLSKILHDLYGGKHQWSGDSDFYREQLGRMIDYDGLCGFESILKTTPLDYPVFPSLSQSFKKFGTSGENVFQQVIQHPDFLP